ncbi:MAG: PKD domain-containing protein, partial [Deltaproteobacteria bacterium]|nr:PKD domain-containing protein [Deltaproteobacteria bacterium]
MVAVDRIVVLVVALSWVSCGARKASPDGTDERDARAPADAADPMRDASTPDALVSPELGIDAGLPANVPPVAAFSFTRDGAGAVTFDASDSVDPDGRIVRFAWDFGDASAGEGATPTHGYAEAGCPTVSLTVTDDRGATASLTRTIAVAITAPSGAPVVRLDPLPRVGSLLPRDVETNRATFTVSGDVASDGWEEVEVRVSSAGTVESTWVAPVCAGAFAHDVELVAELVSRDVAVVLRATGAPEAPIGGVNDLVAGDVLLVQGQSNAVSTQYAGDANESQSDFVRSFGTRTEDAAASVADDAWHRAEGNAN